MLCCRFARGFDFSRLVNGGTAKIIFKIAAFGHCLCLTQGGYVEIQKAVKPGVKNPLGVFHSSYALRRVESVKLIDNIACNFNLFILSALFFECRTSFFDSRFVLLLFCSL